MAAKGSVNEASQSINGELVSRIERKAPVPEPVAVLMSARNVSLAAISFFALEYHA